MKENLGGVSPFNSWVRTVVQIVHKSLLPGRCRNAIAAAGVYVDLKLSSDLLPASVPVTRVMVLGDEGGRRQVTDILNGIHVNSGSQGFLPENAGNSSSPSFPSSSSVPAVPENSRLPAGIQASRTGLLRLLPRAGQ